MSPALFFIGVVMSEFEFKMPRQWSVYFHADESTAMDLAYDLMVNMFNVEPHKADEIIGTADKIGVAYVGTFTKEIADTYVETGELYGKVYDSLLVFSAKAEE